VRVTVDKIIKWIPKKYIYMIESVEQDNEVSEVLLLNGYKSVDGETIWVYGHHNLEEGGTQKSMKEDLIFWLHDADRSV